ncbi:uncharacterized protein LOC132948421 isoform X2 [Metopolophium dirhodum]|nr:uncharacterized protein LOC132948421 isoform X2 [Metopolophium dirhodum]XP_060874864.1 uncharacterized protein LOC132948421 isoform X2 [Metopolophium dirhodum]
MKPQTENWISIANEFNMKWNFPNCVGSIDSKHVVHQAFANSGYTNYNYKGTHSIILLAVCDASYCFTLVDIGAPGRCSDGGVFRNCSCGKQIINKTINFSNAIEIDDENGPISYCVVANEAFPLLTNVMRPYPGRSKGNLPEDQTIFNYRLSRARRSIENAFGILASKWRVFRSLITGSEKTVIVQKPKMLERN